jgi:hypothetical protein
MNFSFWKDVIVGSGHQDERRSSEAESGSADSISKPLFSAVRASRA